MVEVFPVAWTSVNWPAYLKLAHELTGRMISEKFDAAKMPPNIASFLVSLADLTEATGNVQELIEESGSRLGHFSITFLGIMFKETYYDFIEECGGLFVTSTDSNRSAVKVVIITGNGLQWRDAIVNCSSERVPMDVRILANKCQSYFEQQGLGSIWSRYTKTRSHDKTLVLRPK